MTPPLNWNDIDLVVFDVGGTLYDQRRLRLAMLRTLRTFRQVREALGDRPEADFMRLQYARTAARHHKTEDEVRALTSEWMEHRPLPAPGRAVCRLARADSRWQPASGLRHLPRV